MRILIVFVALIYAVAALPALADQVSLKNGDHLTGTIVKSDGKTLVLHTDYAGDVRLQMSAVQSLQSDAPLHVELQDGRNAAGNVTTTDGNIQVSSSAATPMKAPIASITTLRNVAEERAYEKSLHPGLREDWKAGLNLGFALTQGNSQTENLSLGFLAARQTLHDKISAYANSVYAANNAPGAVPATTANTAGGGARYDRDVHDNLFAFANTDFFSDALQSLNLRSVFGGGGGYHAIKSDRTTLDLLLGANYTHESYTGLTRNFAALTAGEELMHKIGKGSVLNESVTFFPDLNSPGDYRGTFNLGTITKLNKWLGWQNSFADIYVTNPPAGKKQNDLVLTTGVSVSFGQ